MKFLKPLIIATLLLAVVLGHPAPARATSEGKLATPDFKVEIIIVAAVA